MEDVFILPMAVFCGLHHLKAASKLIGRIQSKAFMKIIQMETNEEFQLLEALFVHQVFNK